MVFSKYLPDWFIETLQQVAKFNEYGANDYTTEVCDKKGIWTPCDLILREFYNNYGGSSLGFLGISKQDTIKCAFYIKSNQLFLKKIGFYSKRAYNNHGYLLWDNWKL